MSAEIQQRLSNLEETVESLVEENQRKEERIDELEAELEKRPPFELVGDYDPDAFGSEVIKHLQINGWPLGKYLMSRGYEEDIEKVEERVTNLEDDAVTETVEIDRDEMLPIERDMHDRQRGDHDLRGNRLRATYVFEEFQNHATSDRGVLKLPSSQVKNIHQKHGLDDNRNTIRRTMNMVAKHSASLPKDERDVDHNENLIKLKEGSSKNVLIAQKSRWVEHMQDVHEGEGSDETESDEAGGEIADEWAVHDQAVPVTHPSDDPVATDGGSDETEVM